ncbi:MAG: HipA domain-containing protein [Gordonibacter sp.]|uniref:HipA domain-containing protein n=2 Tax=Gordonibacter sp. TaxID=1968902 RepID=UPI002FC96B78
MSLEVYRDIQGRLVKVGVIDDTDSANREPTFRYDVSFLSSPDVTALSFSLPLRSLAFSEEEFKPYFKGLLPEGAALGNLAMTLGISDDDYLELLARCGLDCIGDVVINVQTYQEKRAYRKFSEDEMGALAGHPLARDRLTEGSRLSLAGTQNKCGLYCAQSVGGAREWYQPLGGAPSNCIVKFAHAELSDLMLVEQLCLACARACGIDVPPSCLIDLGAPAICIERYDRIMPTEEQLDGLIVPARQHQEDFTQVFGIMPSAKYKELEPDTVSALSLFLRKYSARPARDIESLARITLFNYLIGNCDNHLKNLSVLYSPDNKAVSLAPAYDVVSTTFYTRFSRKMGMKLGHSSVIDEVCTDDIRLHAKRLGIGQKALKSISCDLLDNAVKGLSDEASNLNKQGFEVAPPIADDIEEGMTSRLAVLASL